MQKVIKVFGLRVGRKLTGVSMKHSSVCGSVLGHLPLEIYFSSILMCIYTLDFLLKLGAILCSFCRGLSNYALLKMF